MDRFIKNQYHQRKLVYFVNGWHTLLPRTAKGAKPFWRKMFLGSKLFLGVKCLSACELTVVTGIYILEKIRNYTKTKVQNGETLPKLNIGIYSKDQYYTRYNIIMYDFIHIIQFVIPIWSWISKMMLKNVTFFHLSFGMWLRGHLYIM